MDADKNISSIPLTLDDIYIKVRYNMGDMIWK